MLAHTLHKSLALAGLSLLLLVAPVSSQETKPTGIDWPEAAQPEVVRVVTRNEDGSAREVKVWIVESNGEGYIRTGRTRWYGNIERDPKVVIRSGEHNYPLRAQLVSDDEARDRVNAEFRSKYGFSDRFSGLARMGATRILRLVARQSP